MVNFSMPMPVPTLQFGRKLQLVTWAMTIQHALSYAVSKRQIMCREAVQGDAVKIASDDWMLARYNDPSTRPVFRRNEVLVKVKDFDLWGAGCMKA